MLESVETEIGEVGSFGMAEYAEDTTLVVEMIVAGIVQNRHFVTGFNFSLTPGSHSHNKQRTQRARRKPAEPRLGLTGNLLSATTIEAADTMRASTYTHGRQPATPHAAA